MLKSLINKIQEKQLDTFCLVSDFRSKTHLNNLKTNQRGLYWIWTNLDFSELKKTEPTEVGSIHVPIDKLVKLREGLNNISSLEKDGFRVVYNGIGGYKKEPAAFGLRERINQELNSNNRRTGTLNILNRGFNIENWAISFFNFDDPENTEILNGLSYLENANDIEIGWRLEFGTPILCRQ